MSEIRYQLITLDELEDLTLDQLEEMEINIIANVGITQNSEMGIDYDRIFPLEVNAEGNQTLDYFIAKGLANGADVSVLLEAQQELNRLITQSSQSQSFFNVYVIGPSVTPSVLTGCPVDCSVGEFVIYRDTESVTLRSPEIGEQHSLITNAIVRKTRGQELKVTKNNFPTFRTFKFDFTALSQQQRDDFFTFFENTAGLMVDVLDECEEEWQGVILDPIVSSKQTGQDGSCTYTLGFLFEGRKV